MVSGLGVWRIWEVGFVFRLGRLQGLEFGAWCDLTQVGEYVLQDV